FWIVSRRPSHCLHSWRCANTFPRSPAASLRSISGEISSCTWSQLIESLCRIGRQAKRRPRLEAARQLFPQGLAAPQDSGLHCPQGNAQNLRNFFVTQIRNVPQHHGFAENRVDLLERRLDHQMLFAIEGFVERRPVPVGYDLLPIASLLQARV